MSAWSVSYDRAYLELGSSFVGKFLDIMRAFMGDAYAMPPLRHHLYTLSHVTKVDIVLPCQKGYGLQCVCMSPLVHRGILQCAGHYGRCIMTSV